MHRFYLPPEDCRTSTLNLSERDAHHAAQVLRIRAGENVSVLDGAGHELVCEVQSASRKNVSLAVRQKIFTSAPPARITLLQAIPKGKMFEWIIEKSVELGVAEIVPLLTERVISQIKPEDRAEKQNRWQLTAIEAIKQCGQTWLPKIKAPMPLKEFLASGEKYELPLVGSLHPGAKHPREFFHQFSQSESRPPGSICIFVGPEGDFTPEEMSRIEAFGAKPITLGKLVLRCETAAIYCLSIIHYEVHSSF